jgi:mono/diheme cytochrome c family protein
MGRSSRAVAIAACAAALAAAHAAPRARAQDRPAGNPAGWQIPPDAKTLASPLTVDAKVIAAGKALYQDKCERCHGETGLGDGPDAEPDAMPEMDLTVAKRAERNPDGVVYYKVWHGRRKPKMPAFKEELTAEQVWTVVAYVQTLRRRS